MCIRGGWWGGREERLILSPSRCIEGNPVTRGIYPGRGYTFSFRGALDSTSGFALLSRIRLLEWALDDNIESIS